MSTASKPATAAFAPITGASPGIGAIFQYHDMFIKQALRFLQG